MNQLPSLLERLSPRPMVCPLVRLGRSSPPDQPVDDTDDVHHSERNYGYRSQYIDYKHQNSERYHNKQRSLDSTFLQKSSEGNFSPSQYYQAPYLIERADYDEKYDRRSPSSPFTHSRIAYQKQKLDLSSLSLGTSYWEYENYNKETQSDSSREYFHSNQTHQNEQNYLLDNFNKLGKSSPSLDQGYHTLVSPSPGSTTPNLWNDNNVYKGKKFTTKNNSFDRLPDDLVIRIMSFLQSYDLSVCARVCRRFDALAWTPSLWRTIHLEGEHISGDRAIRGVLRQLCGQGRTGACPSVERVYLKDGAKITDKGLLLLARRCPELTHVQIQNSVSITNCAIFEITNKCNNLQHLDVTGKFNKYIILSKQFTKARIIKNARLEGVNNTSTIFYLWRRDAHMFRN